MVEIKLRRSKQREYAAQRNKDKKSQGTQMKRELHLCRNPNANYKVNESV